MAEQFILIPGRSSRQGVTLNEGKYTEGYLDETSTLRMNPDDMQRLGLKTGDEIRMWNDMGEVVVPCLDAKDECPEGLVFICYGDKSSRLMAGETHGSGMPDSKGLDVYVQPASLPKPAKIEPETASEPRTARPTTEEKSTEEKGRESFSADATTETGNKRPEQDPQPSMVQSARSNMPEASTPSGAGPTIALILLVIVLIALTTMMSM